MTELFGTALSNANARELPRLGKKRKVLASWRLSLALLLLSFVSVIYAKKSRGTAYEWWRDDIQSGNRAFLVELEMRGGAVLCLSKSRVMKLTEKIRVTYLGSCSRKPRC